MKVKRKCSICGKISEQEVLLSTNRFGFPDLDTRPPKMERSAIMECGLQECPHCGYVAFDLRAPTSVMKEWLKSDKYVSCDNRNFIHALAEKFYKDYLINVVDNNHRFAFFSILRAAWACDDVEDADNAIYCRKKALEELSKFVVDSKEEEETDLLIRADLLRRTGQFDLLIKEYEGKNFLKEEFKRIVAFQIKKAREQDTACYTQGDVEESNFFKE